MSPKEREPEAGEDLVKKDLITRAELQQAKEREAKTGVPFYKQLLQMRKVTFAAVEDLLRYQFQSKTVRGAQETLGRALVDSGDLMEEDLREALSEQKRTGRLLGSILLRRGYVSADAVARALGKQYAMDYADAGSTPSDPKALEAVPESIACENEMLPVRLEGDRLTVLVTGPQNLRRLKNAGVMLKLRIHAAITACEDLEAEIEKRYAAQKEKEEHEAQQPQKQAPDTAHLKIYLEPTLATPEKGKTMDNAEGKGMAEKAGAGDKKPDKESIRFDEIARQASGTSVIKMVNTILEGAVNAGATDIHMDPQEPEMRVRYRIDGVLHDVMSIPETMEAPVISRIKIMSELDITETRHPQDGHISIQVGEREFDVRVATLPTFLGERVVLRLLDQSSVLAGIKDLGFESEDEENFTRCIEQPYGMILVTGPTGSGKTTTLYAALNQKNVMTDSIVTLEDPVEYQLSGINQVQIDSDIDLTFATVLRASLRQDIDVLLVGEIRDMETARIAIRAAMTGHLVFSTLHTNDAPEAIDTLRNMGIPSYLISSALTAVVGQRLVRTICQDCKTAFKPSSLLVKSIGMPATVTKLYRGSGCDKCYHTGNRGRTGIFELLEITPEVRRKIAEDEQGSKIAKDIKLKTMAMRCREKVKNGLVTPEEFLRVIRT
ncbi:MAG TPA: ATPase, T2SS/T4P/T4SS family [Candidatus Hydrogenedentes bacterium]|nr:ATPase, T2SS/T4P/T4SS family [Candidatus Hydrogenedentota bacterium]